MGKPKPNLKLMEVRENNHFSQHELAKMVGVSQSTIQGWESGRYELKNASYCDVMRLAYELRVSPEELVPEKEWKQKSD